jgi:transcriptional regulator with XRE-family HTH domain
LILEKVENQAKLSCGVMVPVVHDAQIIEMKRKRSGGPYRKSDAGPRQMVPGRDLFVREWRMARGLTQEQLEGRTGKAASTISKLENGRMDYTKEHVELLAEAFGTSPADLFYPPPQKEQPLSEFELWARKASSEEKAMALRLVQAARSKAVA